MSASNDSNQSDSSDSVGQSADLRTRIAVVLSEHDPEGSALCDCHYELADVLIRELKLDQPVDFTSAAWGTADD